MDIFKKIPEKPVTCKCGLDIYQSVPKAAFQLIIIFNFSCFPSKYRYFAELFPVNKQTEMIKVPFEQKNMFIAPGIKHHLFILFFFNSSSSSSSSRLFTFFSLNTKFSQNILF